jgi:hypothetical protein
MSRRCEINDQIGKLHTALGNELGSPELLPYEAELVEDLEAVISFQAQQIERHTAHDFSLSTEDGANGRQFLGAFITQVQRQDLERVRYALSSYLRTRLWKLQRHGTHYLRESEETNAKSLRRSRLSPNERKFLKLYQERLSSYLHQAFLQYIPEHLRGLADVEKHQSGRNTEIRMVSEPDTTEIVTAVASPSTETALSNAAGQVDRCSTDPPEIFCVPYQLAREDILRNQAYLV